MQKIQRIHFDELDSTITWVKNHYQEMNQSGVTCVTATIQTAGRGRFARKWVSKKGNLHMSFFYYLEKGDPLIPNLSQLLALSVCSVFPTKIKWPNDILVNGKKLAGVLVELVDCEDKQGIIQSIGMNINTPIVTDQQTTSLAEILGHECDIHEIRDLLLKVFFEQLKKGFSAHEFNDKLAYKGEQISCRIGLEEMRGKLIGVDSRGQLKLEREDGEILKISSGDLMPYRESP